MLERETDRQGVSGCVGSRAREKKGGIKGEMRKERKKKGKEEERAGGGKDMGREKWKMRRRKDKSKKEEKGMEMREDRGGREGAGEGR